MKKIFNIFITIFVFVTLFLPKLSYAEMATSIKDLTETSVTFLATGFPINTDIVFHIENYDSSTPFYSQTGHYMTDNVGIAIFQFTGLSPGGHYKYTHNFTTDEGSFWTFGDPMGTGGGGTGGGGTGGSGGSGPSSLVPCDGIDCDFDQLVNLVMNIINFILFVLAIPIAAIMFAYAGFLLVTSAGSTEQRSKAKSVFTNVAIGLIFVAGAWLIIHTVASIVGYDGSWIGL